MSSSYNPIYYTGIFLPIVILQINSNQAIQYKDTPQRKSLTSDFFERVEILDGTQMGIVYESSYNPNFCNKIIQTQQLLSIYLHEYFLPDQPDIRAKIINMNSSFYMTGELDEIKSISINNLLGKCVMETFTNTEFDNLKITNIGFNQNGWSISNNLTKLCNSPIFPPATGCSCSNNDRYLTNQSNPELMNLNDGSIWSRYYYNTESTDLNSNSFFNSTTIAVFISDITKLVTINTIGQTGLQFNDFSGFSSYVTKTVLYIFLAYFYGQLYQYQEFSNLLLNDFYIKSNQTYNIMNGIPQFIKDKITTNYKNIINISSNLTLPSINLFTSWFIPPTVTVIDTSGNNVYLRCYLPIRIASTFFKQSSVNQNLTISGYLVNFFNEQQDQFYSGNNVTIKNNVLPSFFNLQPALSITTNSSSSLLDIIQSIGNNNTIITSTPTRTVYSSQVMWVDLHTNTTYFYQGGKVMDMSGNDVSSTMPVSLFSSTYTTMNSSSSSSTVDPFVLSIGVTVNVTKWSPKLAAYCLQQMETLSSIITIPSITPPKYPLYNIYLNMSRSGWIPSKFYPIIMSQLTDKNKIRSILLDFCNTYLTPMRNSELAIYETYSYLYPWLLSRYSTGTDISNNDCACVFSSLTPSDIINPNVVSMSYDINCKSMSPNILSAFGVTPDQRSTISNCNKIADWMTNKIKKSFDNITYETSCGTSLYAKKPNTINTSIIDYGGIVILLIGLTIVLLCCALRIPSVYTVIISSSIILSLGIGLYYISKLLAGKWTCSSNSLSRFIPVCYSTEQPTLRLPDEFCRDTKPSCECIDSSSCSFLGVVPPVTTDTSGNCLYRADASGNCYTPYVDVNGDCIHGTDSSGNCFIGSCVAGECTTSDNPRPVQTVTISKMISYELFYFLVIVPMIFKNSITNQ